MAPLASSETTKWGWRSGAQYAGLGLGPLLLDSARGAVLSGKLKRAILWDTVMGVQSLARATDDNALYHPIEDIVTIWLGIMGS